METLGDIGSGTKAIAKPWVYIVTDMPNSVVPALDLNTEQPERSSFPVYKDVVDLFIHLPVFLRERYAKIVGWITSMPSVRPLVLRLAFEYLKEEFGKNFKDESVRYQPLSAESLFRDLVEYIRRNIYDRKNRYLSTSEGYIGQFALNCGEFRSKGGPDYLIHSHFAYLSAPSNVGGIPALPLWRRLLDDINFFLFTQDHLDDQSESWEPKSYFPRSPKDELMELVLACPIKMSFLSRKMSVFSVYRSYVSKAFHPKVNATGFSDSKRLGSVVEAITMVSVVNASHRGGYQGIWLDKFIPWLIADFYPFKHPSKPILDQNCHLATDLSTGVIRNFKIPFLAPLDASFSETLKELSNEFCFGQIETGLDQQELDGISDCGDFILSVECKNYEKSVGQEIVKPIPEKHLSHGSKEKAHLMIMCVSKFVQTINNRTFGHVKSLTGVAGEKIRAGGLAVYLADTVVKMNVEPQVEDQISFKQIYSLAPNDQAQRKNPPRKVRKIEEEITPVTNPTPETIRNVLILIPAETLLGISFTK
jgi:hypothetical protein